MLHTLVTEMHQNHGTLPPDKYWVLARLLYDAKIISRWGQPVTRVELVQFEWHRRNAYNQSLFQQAIDKERNNRILRETADRTIKDLDEYRDGMKEVAPQTLDDLELVMKKELQELVAEVGKMVDHDKGDPESYPAHKVDENLLAVQQKLEKRLESFQGSKEGIDTCDQPARDL